MPTAEAVPTKTTSTAAASATSVACLKLSLRTSFRRDLRALENPIMDLPVLGAFRPRLAAGPRVTASVTYYVSSETPDARAISSALFPNLMTVCSRWTKPGTPSGSASCSCRRGRPGSTAMRWLGEVQERRPCRIVSATTYRTTTSSGSTTRTFTNSPGWMWSRVRPPSGGRCRGASARLRRRARGRRRAQRQSDRARGSGGCLRRFACLQPRRQPRHRSPP